MLDISYMKTPVPPNAQVDITEKTESVILAMMLVPNVLEPELMNVLLVMKDGS
jgi:hypothetical protein